MVPAKPERLEDARPVAASISAVQAPSSTHTGDGLFDSLTGLPNRALIDDRLTQAIPRYNREARISVLAVIGLDGFDGIKDRHGLKAADEVLKEVTKRMSNGLRAGDSLGRLGADTFALLMCGLKDEEPCEGVFKRFLGAVAEPVNLSEGGTISVTATISAAIFPDHGVDAYSVIVRAENALEEARALNRGSFLFAPHPRNRIERP